MNICLVYQDHYPWDIRVEKIINALAEKGYTVHILSRNRSNSATYEKIDNNIYVHRLPVGIGKITKEIINFPAFFSPTWIVKLLSIVIKYNIKLIIVRDLPLGPLGFIVGKITNTKTILDMAENYPELIKSTWVYKGPKIQDYIIRNPYLLKILEKHLLPIMDGIIVVSKKSQERIKLIIGNKKTPVWIIGNTPRLDASSKLFYNPLIDKIKNHKSLKMIYTGMVESHRGLDIVLKSIPYVLQNGIDMLFVVVGKGTYEEKLKTIVNELNIQEHVLFTGWIDSKYIPSIIALSDICIVPHYVTEHTNTTIPNKIYDYMLQKKPVIVTNSESLAEIIKFANCGYIYEDNNPEELAKIICLLQNNVLREKLGLSGYNAVVEYYNWENDKKKLYKTIESIFVQE
jgi:glycosyltransferase involved in cell wall biosynthesis